MEFRQLLAFKTVAEQGSFTAAASQLHLTQSAISQQIKALEDECGIVLFARSSRVVHLSDAGQVLLAHVERILAHMENARLEMAELANGTKGRCRLASLPSIAAYLLPQAIVCFQQRYPGVDLQLMEGLQSNLLTLVQQGTVDFGILGLPVRLPGLESCTLLHDDMVLMVPKEHRLVGRHGVQLEELTDERFVLYPKGAGGRELFFDACHRAGVEPHVAFESDDRETILGLVAAGVGVTIMPRLIAHHTRVDGPVMVNIAAPRLCREVGLVWHRDHYLPQAARNLMAVLREFVQRPDMASRR